MAETIPWSPSGGLQAHRVTLNATATNCTAVAIPLRARFAQLRVLSSGGAAEIWTISHTGTDGAALTGASSWVCLAGETFSLPPAIAEDAVSDATRTVYVCGSSSSARLYVSMGEMRE
jgi:hypothetical protein